jgi:hypothetical protein
MYNKLSDALSGMSFNLSLVAMDDNQAEKALAQLKSDPALAKQVLEEVKKMKPGQKLPITASMNPLVKTILLGLMTLAPAAFADEGGLSSLVNVLKNPSSINVSEVNKIQDQSEKSVTQKQQDELKSLAKSTKPGAILPTPQRIDLKGIKVTPATQGQVALAQKAVKMLNALGGSGANAETVKTQAAAFAKIIHGLHS